MIGKTKQPLTKTQKPCEVDMMVQPPPLAPPFSRCTLSLLSDVPRHQHSNPSSQTLWVSLGLNWRGPHQPACGAARWSLRLELMTHVQVRQQGAGLNIVPGAEIKEKLENICIPQRENTPNEYYSRGVKFSFRLVFPCLCHMKPRLVGLLQEERKC